MPIRRPLHRSDGNRGRIVKALRQVGVLVYDLGEPVDLATLYRGVIRMVEIKNDEQPPSKKKLRKSQIDFMNEWASGPVYKVETISEALRCHGIELDVE